MKKRFYWFAGITAIIFGLTIFLAKNSQELTIFETTLENATVTRKVLVLNFNPIIESQGAKQLTEVLNWNIPAALTDQYILDIFDASRNYFGYQIAEWQDIDDFPQLNDGFDYDDQTWFDCWNNQSLCHSPTQVNYNQILTNYQVCDKLNAGLIDELWLWGGPWFGYWEANMAGTGSFWTNGPVINGSTCNRPIHIMGFNYERSNSQMIENFGHRTEGTMTYVFNEEPRFSPYPHNTPWGKFALFDQAVPGQAACGWIHYAPNSVSDYDWSNQTTVNSQCEDWLNYPNLTATGSAVNCTAWNCNGYEFKKWWLTHLPHVPGMTDNKLNNWWKYIIDFANANSLPDPTPTPSPSPSASPSTTPSPSPSPAPHTCQTNTGAVWCPNHSGIALTIDYDINNWNECINWCRQNMTPILSICQYNGDGPRNCWVNLPPAGGYDNCIWEAGTPFPMGACYNSITPSPSLIPSPSASPSTTPSPSPSPAPEISTISVLAAGKAVDGVYPTAQIYINNQLVKTWKNIKGNPNLRIFRKITFTVPRNILATDIIKIYNRRPTGATNKPRYLRIDKIIVNGTNFQTEAPATLSTGTNSPNGSCLSSYPKSEWLHCTNGYFRYRLK